MKNILIELTQDKRTRTQKLRYLPKNQPELWSEILEATSFLPENASAPQRVWHIMNDIYEEQVCEVTGQRVNWIGYDNGYCKHASHSISRQVVGEKVRKTVNENGHWRNDEDKAKMANEKFSSGFKNGEHKPWEERDRDYAAISEKIQQTCIERYGVNSVFKLDRVKKRNSELMYERNIKNGGTPRERRDERRRYYDEVAIQTEKNWNEHFYKINPDRLERGPELHLDHIYSRQQGFMNGIAPEVIGHWTNLRLISRLENSSKRHRCDKTLEQLLEDFYSQNI